MGSDGDEGAANAWIVVVRGHDASDEEIGEDVGADWGTVLVCALRWEPALRFVLGRGRECDMPLGDPLLGRRHVCIETDATRPGAWFVCDGGSTNGTYVDGARTQRMALHEGARVRFGHTWLHLFVGSGAEARAEQAAREAREWAAASNARSRVGPKIRAERALIASVRSSVSDALVSGRPLVLLSASAVPNDSEWLVWVARRIFRDPLALGTHEGRLIVLLPCNLDEAMESAELLRSFRDPGGGIRIRTYKPVVSVGLARLEKEAQGSYPDPASALLAASRGALARSTEGAETLSRLTPERRR